MTDPDAPLYSKSEGATAMPGNMGYLLTKNRHRTVFDAQMTQSTGKAEWDATITMVEALSGGSFPSGRE